MANIEDMVIKLKLETSQMKSELGAVKGQMAGLGAGMTGAVAPVRTLTGAMGGLMKSLLPIMAATAVISFLKDSAKAAAEDNTAQALLARQIEATTGATKDQIAGVEQQVSALEMMSGVADDQIRPALAGLVRATGDTTKALELQRIALDVSAATGKDVGAVSHAMAKAMNGNSTALERMIPALKGNKDQMGYLIKNFDGAAKKAADVNPYKKLSVAMDSIKEGIGRGVLPIVKVFADLMVRLSPIFDKVGQVLEKVLDPIMKLVDVVLGALMPPLETLMDIFMELVDQIMPPLNDFIQAILVPILDILGDALKQLMPIIKVIAGIIGRNLTTSIKIVTAILKPFIAIIKNVWNALAPLRRALQVLWNILGQVAKQIGDKVMKTFRSLWQFIQKNILPMWNNLMKAMKPFVDFIVKNVVGALKNFLNFLKPVWDFIRPMIDGIAKLLGVKIDMKAAMKVDTSDADKAVAKVKKTNLVTSFGSGTGGGGSGTGGGKKKKAKNVTNINTNVNAKTDAKPQDIAANIVNAVKFNLPVAIAGGTGIVSTGMGSQIGGFGGSGVGA